jgi:hypothetical protein
VSRDFEELLESFNGAGVRFLIGGAHALALHARPRATKDLDVFVDPTRANARRVLAALGNFFGGSSPSFVTEATVLDPNTLIQLGVAPVRVDILSAFGTLTFREAWKHRVEATFGSVPASYLSREHPIAEKLHFDRPRSGRRCKLDGRGSRAQAEQERKAQEGQAQRMNRSSPGAPPLLRCGADGLARQRLVPLAQASSDIIKADGQPHE